MFVAQFGVAFWGALTGIIHTDFVLPTFDITIYDASTLVGDLAAEAGVALLDEIGAVTGDAFEILTRFIGLTANSTAAVATVDEIAAAVGDHSAFSVTIDATALAELVNATVGVGVASTAVDMPGLSTMIFKLDDPTGVGVMGITQLLVRLRLAHTLMLRASVSVVTGAAIDGSLCVTAIGDGESSTFEFLIFALGLKLGITLRSTSRIAGVGPIGKGNVVDIVVQVTAHQSRHQADNQSEGEKFWRLAGVHQKLPVRSKIALRASSVDATCGCRDTEPSSPVE